MTTSQSEAAVVLAGASAQAEAASHLLAAAICGEQASLFEVAAQAHVRKADAFERGSKGEDSVYATVSQHLGTEWVLLPDRRWPGTRSANIDLIVVGPGGVFIVDVKNWANPRVEDGRLYCGQVDDSEALAKVQDQADAIAAGLTAHSLSPNEVNPVIVLAGHQMSAKRMGAVYVVGERDLASYWARHGPRLTRADVATLVTALNALAPPMPTRAKIPTPRPSVARRAPASLDQAALLTVEDVIAQSCAIAEAGSIERWMVWLDPQQSPLVNREWNGPARIRGAAGTGKTVVALHRVERLTRRSQSVLMTSYVRTLSDVHRELFSLLAPDLKGIPEFTGLHAWCSRYLRKRGIEIDVDESAGTRAFPLALSRSGAIGALNGLGLNTDYWWEEVTAVIKGRGIATAEEYFATTRTGRGVPLQRIHRESLWSAYEEYELRRVADGRHDWTDLLLLTLAELERDDATGYDAVVVDEVQDLPIVGLRLVARLTRRNPSGLFLVGDGQQAIYPGGGSLREAGISVAGRSTILGRNYRNSRAIVERALRVVETDSFDDLGDLPEAGRRDLDLAREGGEVEELDFATPSAMRAALVARLRCLEDPGAAAVLCRSGAEVDEWLAILQSRGIDAEPLAGYRGRTSGAVKVGTYQRAKGLEFAFVALPQIHLAVAPQRPDENDERFAERAALQRRQLFVAMTRARDNLWLGSVAASR